MKTPDKEQIKRLLRFPVTVDQADIEFYTLSILAIILILIIA
jgi:hypothetical protein